MLRVCGCEQALAYFTFSSRSRSLSSSLCSPSSAGSSSSSSGNGATDSSSCIASRFSPFFACSLSIRSRSTRVGFSSCAGSSGTMTSFSWIAGLSFLVGSIVTPFRATEHVRSCCSPPEKRLGVIIIKDTITTHRQRQAAWPGRIFGVDEISDRLARAQGGEVIT
jgi:hypothetical protein